MLLATSITATPSQALPGNVNAVEVDGMERRKEVAVKKEVVKKTCDSEGKDAKMCVRELISKYAKLYDANERLVLDIAFCESSFRANVYGDGGRAFGPFQFHRATFESFSKSMGEKLDYFNVEDNIKLGVWALANNKEDHWACYEKVAFK